MQHLPVEIDYEGLRQTLQALAVVDEQLSKTLKVGLRKSGEVIEIESRRRFVAYGGTPWFEQSGESFETRVRAGGQATAIVVVGQRRRSTSDQLRRRPSWGGLQVKHGLLPGREARLAETAEILEREVASELRRHGF